jgi:hypothetical protein
MLHTSLSKYLSAEKRGKYTINYFYRRINWIIHNHWNMPGGTFTALVLGDMKLKFVIWSKVNLQNSNFISAIRPKIYFCEFSIQNNVILLYYLCVMTYDTQFLIIFRFSQKISNWRGNTSSRYITKPCNVNIYSHQTNLNIFKICQKLCGNIFRLWFVNKFPLLTAVSTFMHEIITF